MRELIVMPTRCLPLENGHGDRLRTRGPSCYSRCGEMSRRSLSERGGRDFKDPLPADGLELIAGDQGREMVRGGRQFGSKGVQRPRRRWTLGGGLLRITYWLWGARLSTYPSLLLFCFMVAFSLILCLLTVWTEDRRA